MPEESFYCPHCNRHAKKSTQAYLIGESMAVGGTFVVMGGMPETLRCPGCGGDIDMKKMLQGEYDARSGRAGGDASKTFGLIIVAGLIALAAYFIWFR